MPASAPAPVSQPTADARHAMATPPVTVGNKPIFCAPAGTRRARRYVVAVAQMYAGAAVVRKLSSTQGISARGTSATVAASHRSSGGVSPHTARAASAAFILFLRRASAVFVVCFSSSPAARIAFFAASSFSSSPVAGEGDENACATFPAANMVASVPAAHAAAAVHRSPPAGRLDTGTAVMYGMNTHAICASTASTAGFSVREMARSSLPSGGTASRIAVSATSAVTSGATATPAADMRNATRRRYRSRKATPVPTLRHQRTSAASTALEWRGVGACTENALVTELRARVERRRARSRVPGVREEHRRGGGRSRSAVPTARHEPEAAHRGRQVADTASEAFERDGSGAAAARGALRAGAWGREAPLTAARTAAMVCLRGRD